MDIEEEASEEQAKERERLEEERERLQQEIQNDSNITELPSPEEIKLKKVEGLAAIAPPNLLLSDDEDDLVDFSIREDLVDFSIREEGEDEPTENGEARTEEEEDDSEVPTKSDEDQNGKDCDNDEDEERERRASVTSSPKSPGRRKSKKLKSKRRRKKKKAVSFAEGVLVYTDTRVAKERQAMFYSEQEMDEFRQDVAYHASVLMSNNPDNGDYVQMQAAASANLPQHEGSKMDESGLCLLGVEHHFLNETYKQKQKLKAILAVLMEQDRQYKEDGHFTPVDDVSMSKAYQRVSRISHKEAHERGLRSLMRDGGGGDTEPSSSTSSLYAPASPMSVAGD